MKTTMNEVLERQDIEELLPWYAAGALSRRDTQRVEQALQRDPDLGRQLVIVREDLSETIHFNETLGAPSANALNKLMAGIEAESGPAPAQTRMSFGAWLNEKLSTFSARKLAYAAAVGAVVIVAQAGVLTSLYVGDQRFDDSTPLTRGIDVGGTRSVGPASPATGQGSYVLVKFVPGATSAEITRFLDLHRLAIVDGPRTDGAYRVRVSLNALSRDDLGRIAVRMRENGAIISSAVTAD
ncbi:MAG: hypothetical protein J0H62_03210 [Rhizobiales bacterium]|nr:hypothetical protein [Hyphomicrobiales bacterium]